MCVVNLYILHVDLHVVQVSRRLQSSNHIYHTNIYKIKSLNLLTRDCGVLWSGHFP